MHLENQQSAATTQTQNNPDEIRISFEPSILFNDPECSGREYFSDFFKKEKATDEEVLELENLVKQYEDEPILASFLAGAHRKMGNDDFANQIVRDNYRKFPFSLFARCDYAYLCLNEDHPTQAAAALSYIFNLRQLYPKRSKFHILELLEFQRLVIHYFCAIKDFNRAITALIPLQSLHVDISNIKKVRSLIITKVLEENLSFKSLSTLFSDAVGEDNAHNDEYVIGDEE
jgi:hypothetical protein